MTPNANHRCRSTRFAALVSAGGIVIATLLSAPGAAGAQPPPPETDQVVPGAQPTPGTTTIPTWQDTFTDPTNSTTYTVDLVGRQDPRTGTAGTTTVPTELIPVDLAFAGSGGQSFDGSAVTQAVLHSPIFQPADYSSFSANVGVQYLDAVMRSEFDRAGASAYHLELTPTVLPTLALSVPANKGQVLTYPQNGKQYGCVDGHWLADRMWEYLHSHGVSPATLPVLLLEYTRGGFMSHGACIPSFSGLHGAGNPAVGRGAGHSETMGQTWIITTYEPTAIRPPTPDHPYTYRDIDTLAHEVAEWANDPYGNNQVDPYQFPDVGTSGTFCDPSFETGDPVNQYTVLVPGNTYFQDLPGTDGNWSLQDEVFLPWFAREFPNTTSEPERSSGAGRYTFFGDRNPDQRFHVPATGCS